MKYARFVCLIALSLIVNSPHPANAQTPPMTAGVSVQMAPTKTAVAYPAADTTDAWILVITADGHLFFGTKSVTPDQLFEEMKSTPRHRDARLYVKADARSTFSSLKSALGPARSVKFAEVVLLTSQPTNGGPGTMVPPQGIEVQILPQSPNTTIDVRILRQAGESTLTLNGKTVTWSELPSTLKSLVGPSNQVVQVEADDSVPVGELIHILDEARKAGASASVPMFHSL
jgi:biopolymer transport protein ExbD